MLLTSWVVLLIVALTTIFIWIVFGIFCLIWEKILQKKVEKILKKFEIRNYEESNKQNKK